MFSFVRLPIQFMNLFLCSHWRAGEEVLASTGAADVVV